MEENIRHRLKTKKPEIRNPKPETISNDPNPNDQNSLMNWLIVDESYGLYKVYF
jgi:hypothetical protein